MPKKNQTKTPAKKIDRFIERHMEGGEPVTDLVKEYKISRATAYLWLAKYREKMIEASMKTGMSKAELEKTEKSSLRIQNEQLRRENIALRNKVMSLMLKHGEI